MICRFHNIIDIHSICGNTNRVGFVNISRLVMCQTAAFDVIHVKMAAGETVSYYFRISFGVFPVMAAKIRRK